MPFRIAMIITFAAWPVIAFVTGLAFSPLMVLVGLLALVGLKSRMGIPLAAWCLFAFLGWAMITTLWSPNNEGLISGNLMEGTFAVESAALRLVPVVLAGLLAAVAASRLRPRQAAELCRVSGSAILVHAALLGVAAVLFVQIIGLLAPLGDSANEGHQNLIRSANLFAMAFGLCIGVSPLNVLRPVALVLAIAVVGLGAVAVCQRLDAQGAAIGLLLGPLVFAAMGLAGFRGVFGLLAAYILSAPLLVRAIGWLTEVTELSLPASFQARVWAWQTVSDKIADAPLLGHGLEAAETWTETYAAYPDWLAQVPENWSRYPVVPGHPHNMPLQVWAETGAVGAVLVAAALIMFGWMLPTMRSLSLGERVASAGLIGGAVSHVSFAYDLWNDAFWAAVALIGVGIIALRQSQAEA